MFDMPPYRRAGQVCAWGNATFRSQNNILQGDRGKLKMSGASAIFGGHRISLHANCYFTAELK